MRTTLVYPIRLDREITADRCNDDRTVTGGQALVNNQYIAILNASAHHRITTGANKKSRRRTIDQQSIQIQRRFTIRLCRRRKTSYYISNQKYCLILNHFHKIILITFVWLTKINYIIQLIFARNYHIFFSIKNYDG